MEKYLTIIIFAFGLLSCENSQKERLKKPFIIVGKSYGCCDNSNASEYIYQDANGKSVSFTDSNNAYKV